MIKSIIIEDELMAMKSLERLCTKVSDLELVNQFHNGYEAIEFLKKEQIDLIFLDVEMPDISGFEVLDKLDEIPQVIFTTSNKEYAFDAYEYDITDFIKKPVEEKRFNKALEKVRENLARLNHVRQASEKREIYVRVDGKYVRLPYSDILYFENIGDYMKVFTLDGMYVIHASIKHITSNVNHSSFLKVHRSYVVNLEHVKDIQDGTLVIGKKVIPVSRAHRPVLLANIHII